MTGAAAAPEAAVAWRAATVTYPYASAASVGPVDVEVRPGERLLLLGPSGCGKSTLLATVTGLVPQAIPATVNGRVVTFGTPASARSPAQWAERVAQLFQDCEQTLCGMTVADEIAFALESRALPAGEIDRRMAGAMARAGLPEAWTHRRSSTLSGGHKQLVALAACLAQEADLFVADEPTAHLSPAAARRLHALLAQRAGTVIVVDHRLDGMVERIDRAVVMGRHGTVLAQGEPRRLFRDHGNLLAEQGIWRPLASDLDRALATEGIVLAAPPLAIGEVLAELDALPRDRAEAARMIASAFVAMRTARRHHVCAPVAGLRDAACAPLFAKPVLRGVDLSVAAGETIAVLGANGAGKSTLGATLARLLRPKAGVRFGPPGGFAFQRPETQFTEPSVHAELAATGGDVDALLDAWRLRDAAERHPFDLSQGQKRRLSLAALTADQRWPLIVLDEPTAGLDSAACDEIAARIGALAQAGKAVVVITHDLDFALRTCRRGVLVHEGGIAADLPMRELVRDDALLVRADLAVPELARLMRWCEDGPC